MTDPGGENGDNTIGTSLEEVEGALLDELAGVTLVGELDLDVWAPLAEEGLATRVHRADAATMAKRWPASFVTYLVGEGLTRSDEQGFWEQVSLEPLRTTVAGRAFADALTALGLPTFDDLEELEGIGRDTRNKWIRRIHLHGGIPRSDVGALLDLLAPTLRAGLLTPAEVVDGWASIDLKAILNRRAPARVLMYTGDFGVTIVGQLIELLRAMSHGEDPEVVAGVPAHLAQGARDWLERRRGRPPIAFEFRLGPRVLLPHGGDAVPILWVPAGKAVEWRVDGAIVGVASNQVARHLPLPPPADGSGWSIEADGEPARRFTSQAPGTSVFVFDERGRLHRRGTTLGGLRAQVLAPAGTAVSGSVDVRSVTGWSDWELIDTDLRGSGTLSITGPGAPPVSVPVDTMMRPRLVGDRCHGVTTLDGAPVFGDRVRLAFNGFIPEPRSVLVAVDGVARSLHELETAEGEFDLAPLLAERGTLGSTVVIARTDDEEQLRFAQVPGLGSDRPRLAPPGRPVQVVLDVPEGEERRRFEVTIPGAEDRAEGRIVAHGLAHHLVVQLDRLQWNIVGPSTLVPIAGTEGFSIRLQDLRDQALELSTNGVPAAVTLLDADAEHTEWARPHRQDRRMLVLRLRGFADTARAATAARTRIAVTRWDLPPFTIGVIEGRYEPWDVTATPTVDGSLRVSWTELTEWPGRVVRIWGDDDAPLASQPVADGASEAVLATPEVPPGRYLVEVTTDAGWGRPSRPTSGPSTCAVYLGDLDATRLQQAVTDGDRRQRFDDATLDRLIPLLVDLAQECFTPSAPRSARGALLALLLEEPSRAALVLSEWAATLSSAEPLPVDAALLGALPGLFDAPIRWSGEDTAAALERLWLVAPVAAAHLDACRSDLLGPRRWAAATKVRMTPDVEATPSFDSIAGRIPDDLYGPRDANALLQRPGWAAAIHELDLSTRSADGQALARDLRAVRRRLDDLKGVRWQAMVTRIRNRVAALGEGPELLPIMAGLALAQLDASCTPRPDDERELLRRAQRRLPVTTHQILVLAPTCLRLLEAT